MTRMQMSRIIALWMAGLLIAAQPCMAMVVGYSRAGGSAWTTIVFDDFNRADSSIVGGPWTSETDNDGNLGIIGNKLVWTDTTGTAAYVSKTLPGSAEAEQSVKITLNKVSGWAPNKYIRYAIFRHSIGTSLDVSLMANSSGAVVGIKTTCYDRSGVATSADTAISFAAGVEYTIAATVKVASGASVADGYCKVAVDGVEKYALLNFSNYRASGITELRTGAIYVSGYGADNDIIITMDDSLVGAK